MNMAVNFLSVNKVDQIALVVLIAFLVLLGAAMLFAFITKIIVALTYRRYNKVSCAKTLTAQQQTGELLNVLSLKDVKVKKVGFFRSMLGLNMQGYGNSYSSYKKAIYLRKNIINKNSITAYAVSSQKVAHAEFDSQKKHTFYYKFKPFMLFAPITIAPLMIIGLLLDLYLYGEIGKVSMIFAFLSLVIFLSSFVLLFLTIPIEKSANKRSEELLLQTNSVTEKELELIKKVNKSYIASYIADFVYALLQIIWDILKILIKLASLKNNK